MITSKTFESQFEDRNLTRMRREIAREQVVVWDRKRIREAYPDGYDMSKVNCTSSCPNTILKSITGRQEHDYY